MWLLTFSIILFFVVIGLIIYANWPASASSSSCGGGCGGGCSSCQKRSCNRCYKPRGQCGCGGGGNSGGCPFC
jgi:hypothetical protein